jgi:transcriptional regulator with GAF, ATPase, and Fis domain
MTFNSQVPAIIEEIIMKLLEKTMDRRYKSAYGLRMDLENCLQQWKANGGCERFVIAQQDGTLLLDINSGSSDQPVMLTERTEFETSETSNGYSQVLELAAVMRASQAFTEETDSYHLLSKLMSILIEVAGAQRGCIVAARATELYVEQIVEADSSGQPIRGGIPLNQFENVCQNLISYVAIKRHFVIMEDAVTEGLFTQDPYVQRHKPKSVLGLPIIAQGELQGVLYLENNLISGVFAAERLGVLHMLASQINYVQRLLGYYGS